MAVSAGQIVNELVPTEAVTITNIRELGGMMSVSYTGITSKVSSNKVLTKEEFERLKSVIVEGTFDFTGDPVRFTLGTEAERISSAFQFDPLFGVNCSVVDPLPHQIEAVYKFLLPLPKIRFLLADDTGAGKTIMAGLLVKELLLRGAIERVLIVTPGGLTKQWQEDELAVKFNLPFTLVNRARFASEPNIFHTAQRVVTSIDFISRPDVLTVAEKSDWDLIVFDEAHKLSAYDYGAKVYHSQRYQTAQKLAQQCEHLLLLTATPHRGRMDTFRMLLQLLDEDIFSTNEVTQARVKEFERNGVNKFFIRRLKEDMRGWDSKPLFTNRYTRTVAYELTFEEKDLYDAVTEYLMTKKAEASQAKNIHVALALSVMQRRLVSSIYAIKNTLERRYRALQGIVDELRRNPNLWQQRHKLEGFDVGDMEDYDELADDEREAWENILADPKKFKLFTTAKSVPEIQSEAEEVKRLYTLAERLYQSGQEEHKFKKLRELLASENVLGGEKLVIFTEHKDTLLYLEERLRNNGYTVVTIHGAKGVDERRQAQWDFAKPETQILLATDAAGEGINLQFCRLLINWDIPWNPNRLEQRMGRIHRYGQKQDVLVFNLVADNTREGQVLSRLLQKLDIIRESIGDDRVYDVIQDVLENVRLKDIINSVFNGKATALDDLLAQPDEQLKQEFAGRIQAQREQLAHSAVDYSDARQLKDHSDERRLQPIYVRLFFERALTYLGGAFTEVRPAIFRIDRLPESVGVMLRKEHNIYADVLQQILFCFDKRVFLDYQNMGDLGKVHYINPGNPIFDAVLRVIRETCREDLLKGTVLIAPDDSAEYLAFFVRSVITDNRIVRQGESVTDERLLLIQQDAAGRFSVTSSAKFLDLHPPAEFSKPLTLRDAVHQEKVIEWSFERVTLKQLAETQERVNTDAAQRREYLQTSFTRAIVDLQMQISALQGKLLLGDGSVQEQINRQQQRVRDLVARREKRLQSLVAMTQVAPKLPEVLGCAYVVPLTQVEYRGHFGMSRDDEAEAIAMQTAMDYERAQGWTPQDVSADNEGYDIRSISPELLKRYIEVKGRSGPEGSVMLTENEMNRLAQLGAAAWLYIVVNCKTQPELYRVQNPAHVLRFEARSKGVQYFLPMTEWQAHL